MYSSISDMLELVKIHNSQELTDHRSEQGKLLLVLIMMWCCKYFALADVMCCSDLHVTHSSSTGCPVHNQAISLARSCMHKRFSGNILSHLDLGISYRPKKVYWLFNKKEVWSEAFTAFKLFILVQQSEAVFQRPCRCPSAHWIWQHLLFMPRSRFLKNIW